jgi:hypothetical protein
MPFANWQGAEVATASMGERDDVASFFFLHASLMTN